MFDPNDPHDAPDQCAVAEELIIPAEVLPAQAHARRALGSSTMHEAMVAMLGYVRAQVGWEETRWWRVMGPDGVMQYETSDGDEARRTMRFGDTLQKLWRREESEWRDAE